MTTHSIQEAAKLIGVGYSTLYRWSTGDDPTLHTAIVDGKRRVSANEVKRVKKLVKEQKEVCVDCGGPRTPQTSKNWGRRCGPCSTTSAATYHLARQFGLTLKQYESVLEDQGGMCAICGQPETEQRGGVTKPLCVDHDHQTDQVRGLLCNSCNRHLGIVESKPEWWRSAKRYLRKHE